MSGIRGVIRRFGMPDAISWPAFWTTFLSAFVGIFVTNAGPVPLVTRIGILLIGSIPLWSLLLLARAIFFRDPQRSRPVVMLIALTVGVIFRASVIAALFAVLVGPSEAKLGPRVIGALINVGLAYVLTANVVVAIRERRRQIATLQSQQLLLDSAIARVASGIEEQNEQTIERVRTVLMNELSALEGASADQSLSVLQKTAGDVVRPLSHELAHAVPRVESHTGDADPTTVSWPVVINEAASGRPFSPWIVAMLIAIESVGAVLQDPKGSLVFLGVSGAVVVLLAVSNGVLERLLVGKSRPTRIALVVVAAVVSGAIVGALEIIVRGTASVNIAIGVALGIFTATFALGTAVVTALGRNRDRVIRELQVSSRELEHGLVRLRQVQWFQQKALSRALHGPIQMAVTAAAIKLDAAIQQGSVQPGLVDSVRGDLLAGLDVLHEADSEVVGLDRAIERMRATFEGVCAVETTVGDSAVEVLAADGVLRSCVIDILSEAVANAVFHGKADRATVTIVLDSVVSDVLHVEVTSNGPVAIESERRGLGSQQLDDWTLSWSREISERGSRLEAVLPVAPVGV